MRNRIIYILLAVTALTSVHLYGQDSRIAHPFLWNSYYNPAYCGSEENIKVDLNAQSNYTYAPSLFIDNHLSTEFGKSVKDRVIFGIGIKANNEYQGNGLLNITSANVMASIGLSLSDRVDIKSTLHIGASFDMLFAHINRNKMVWADQLNPYYGQVLNYSAELSYIAEDNLNSYDMSWGIYGKTTFDVNRGRPIILNYGFSMSHVIGADNRTFYDGQASSLYVPSLRYRHYTAQLGYSHPYISDRGTKMSFDLYGLYEYQAGLNDIQLGFLYHIFRFRVGVGTKVEKYNSYTLTNLIFHLVYHQPLNNYSEMGIAYSFETPLTQGSVTETSIHSLSLHFIINYENIRRCKSFPVSDNAWYEMNNTFPSGR